jgi:hypothetical protein
VARKKKGKKRPPESMLESVFGVRLNANADGDSGNQPAPNPKPEVDPAVTAAEARATAAEARAEKIERLADMADIRAAAVEVAIAQGVKQQRARAFVENLLDLSGVGVNSDGEPDTAEIARIVHAGTEEYPELTAARGSLYGNAPHGSRYDGAPYPSLRVGG